jgi:aryl-alcohol dehydrogenase-like predicted oxidoreductase
MGQHHPPAWIDLYQIHRPDPHSDIDETLAMLTDIVHAGKIRYFGHSPGRNGEADDGSRTRDLRLGKPTLYQLSYVRAGARF